MEIKYSLELPDVLALHQRLMKGSANGASSHWFGFLFFGMIATGFFGMAVWQVIHADRPKPIMYVILVGYSILCIGSIFALWARSFMKKNTITNFNNAKTLGQMDGLHCIISPENVTLIDHQSAAMINWSMIEKIAETPDHLFIFRAKNTANIIPKRAFADEKQCSQFRDLMYQFHNVHKFGVVK